MLKLPTLLKSLLFILICASSVAQASEPLTFFRIGTGPSTETLYRLGTAISAGISRPPGGSPCDEGGICGVPGLIAVAQSKSGSLENLKALRNGELEAALVSTDMVLWAYVGYGPFEDDGAFDDLRVISNLTPIKVHFIVRANSRFKYISNLNRARVSVGQINTGESMVAKIILSAHGVDPENVDIRYMRPGPATDAIANSTLDVMILFGAEPVEVISDLTRNADIRMLPLTDDALYNVQEYHPFFGRGEIPADTYKGVAATPTFQLGVQWVVRKDADPELIKAITRAFWQGQTEEIFKNDNPNINFPNKEFAVPYGWGPPLHDGAKEYYHQVGLYQE